MAAISSTLTQHFKKVIIKQQTVGAASAQVTQLAQADISGTIVNAVNAVVPTPDNIFIQASTGNSGTITLMPVNPAVSLGAGYILSAGQSVSLPTKNPAEWFVIGSAASQVLNIHYQFGVA
jgi:hypothetical protein